MAEEAVEPVGPPPADNSNEVSTALVPAAAAAPAMGATVGVVTNFIPNTTGSLAVFGPAAERTTYHRALVFKDPGGKVCTKACCMNQLHGGYRSIKLKDKQSGEELAGVKLRQARLQKQVEDQKAKFLQLSELVGEVLNVEQATGEDDADVIEFELQSVGKQMLQRLDHRFFAGYSQEQLDQLVSRGEVHPNTMLKTDGTGNMRTHGTNYMHLHSRTAADYQRFACLATAGEVVRRYEASDKSAEDISTAHRAFGAVIFVNFDNTGTMVEKTPFEGNWGVLAPVCLKFYNTVVLAPDSRTAYVDVVVAIENPNEAGVNALKSLTMSGVRARAKAAVASAGDGASAAQANLVSAEAGDFSCTKNVLTYASRTWREAFTMSGVQQKNNPYKQE
jgi:hypothetical protein